MRSGTQRLPNTQSAPPKRSDCLLSSSRGARCSPSWLLRIRSAGATQTQRGRSETGAHAFRGMSTGTKQQQHVQSRPPKWSDCFLSSSRGARWPASRPIRAHSVEALEILEGTEGTPRNARPCPTGHDPPLHANPPAQVMKFHMKPKQQQEKKTRQSLE